MPWGVAAAAVTAGAGIYESSKASGAANKAASEQAAGAAAANTTLNAQLPVDQGYLAPYTATGNTANNSLQLMMGNPTAFQAQFKASPGYQYNLQQQQGAIDNSAAASGGLAGGNTLKALQTNASGLASQDYQSYIPNLMSLQGTGLPAANGQANLGQNYASNFGNNLIGAANATSAGTVAANNASTAGMTPATNSLASLLNNNNFQGYLTNAFGGGAANTATGVGNGTSPATGY